MKKQKSEKFKHELKLSMITDWRKEHANLDLDFIAGSNGNPHLCVPIPSESQDFVIIKDLIQCLMGKNGIYVTALPVSDPYGHRTFVIHDGVHPRVAELAQKVLKLASHYSIFVRFIQDNRLILCGRVNQALSAALDEIRSNYLESIIDLEKTVSKKSLSIHYLWHLIQPMVQSFSFLECLIMTIVKQKARGGKTLTILHQFANIHSLESFVKSMALFLIKASSKPYFESVQKWIFQGIIFDPYNEFMIFENTRIAVTPNIDEFWFKKYLIRKENIPCFLEKASEMILNCGKYLDAASSCSLVELSSDSASENEMEYSLSGAEYFAEIERAYDFASKQLLGIIMKDYNITDRMKSVKRYFLLEQGDFIVTVFDICREELSKNISDIIPSKFSALIEIAVRIPSTDDDAYRDDIILNLKPIGLVEQVEKILSINTDDECKVTSANESRELLNGIDAFTLALKSQWPVSLIFSKKIMSCYQMLFRHLVYTKYIEMLLCKVWLRDMTNKCKESLPLHYYHLRHRMLYFVQNSSYYMMTEAIEPNWLALMSELQTINSVDDLLKRHWVFIDACIKDCLLTNVSLLHSYRNLLNLCLRFTEFVSTIDYEPMGPTVFGQRVEDIRNDFDNELENFLKIASSSAHVDVSDKLHSLLYRFDVNLVFND